MHADTEYQKQDPGHCNESLHLTISVTHSHNTKPTTSRLLGRPQKRGKDNIKVTVEKGSILDAVECNNICLQ